MKITKTDKERLAPHLANWNKLNELFVMDAITTSDLKIMIGLELAGEGRVRILEKLLGRLYSSLRRQSLASILLCNENRQRNSLKRKSADGARPTDTSITSFPAPPEEAFQIELPSLQVEELVFLNSNAKEANQRRSSARKSSL